MREGTPSEGGASAPVAVITGATRGIGLKTAQGLDAHGFQVVVLARDPALAGRALAGLRRGADVVEADLASLESVRRAAGAVRGRHATIDVLVNNAGVMKRRRELTPDGFEVNWAVNHLSPLLLTIELLGHVDPARGRIVNVNSEGHRVALMSSRSVQLDFDDLQSERDYSVFDAYSRSKLAQLMATYELARRIDPIAVNAIHPGMVKTDIARELPRTITAPFHALFSGSATDAARAVVELATAPGRAGVSGRYFDRFRETASSAASRDRSASERVWTLSCEMLGVAEADVRARLAAQTPGSRADPGLRPSHDPARGR